MSRASYWSDPGHHPPPPAWVVVFSLAWAASLGYAVTRCALSAYEFVTGRKS